MKQKHFLGLVAILMAVQAVQAYPTSGANCANCHSDVSPAPTTYLSILGNPSTSGGKKQFTAAQGGTFTISYEASLDVPSGDNYAFSLSGFNVGGTTLAANKLTLTAVSPVGYTWSSGTGTSATTTSFRYYTTDYLTGNAGTHSLYSMTFQVSPSTPLDSYQLRVSMAGSLQPTQWAQLENILITVVPEPQTYALASGVGLLGFVAVRRLVGKHRKP